MRGIGSISRAATLPTAALVTGILLLSAACGGGAAPAPTVAPPPAGQTPVTKSAATPVTGASAVAKSTSPVANAASPVAGGASPVAKSATTQYAVTGPLASESKTLNGAGATFPAPLYSKWFEVYNKLTQVKVNYQSIGSGGGKKSITDKTVDFAGSDAPMSDAELKAASGTILHIPAALGAVVPTYNLSGVTTPIKFTPETLVGIYLGEITKWNDPKLLADNPDLKLPAADIIVVHRTDGSGTTDIFTNYLSAVSPAWKSKVGAGTSVNWPVGLGGKGNEGVAGEVKQNPNSIGYVELIYAIQNKLPAGLMKNKAGKFVEPTLATTSAAAAGVANTIAPDLRATIVNADGDTSWPISGFTWLLVYDKIDDKAKAEAVTRMLWWAIHEGQTYNESLGYAKVPDPIAKKSEAKILSITTGGQPALPTN